VDEEKDHQNEGIGVLGVEGPDSIGGHRERQQSIGGTISISSGGFEFDQTPEEPSTSTFTFDIGSGPKVDPLFVLPWKYDSKLKEHKDDLCLTPTTSNIQDLCTAVQHCQVKEKEVFDEISTTSSFEDSVNRERRRNKSGQRLVDLVAPLAPHAKPIKKKSLSSQDDESIDELSSNATPSPCVTPFSTPAVTPAVTPGVTPVVTPAGSPTRQRKVQKVTGVVMDPSATSMAISSYFFTKPFKSSHDQMDSVKRTEQLLEAAKLGGSSESKPKLGKPCKPKAKPTALREMNFWAPTSM